MDSIYKRRINHLKKRLSTDKDDYNWFDIIEILNLNDISKKESDKFVYKVYKEICLKFNIECFNIKNVKHKLYNICLNIDCIQDNGNLMFIKYVKDLSYDNLNLKDEEYTNIQLQLACCDLKVCNIFYCILEDKKKKIKGKKIEENLFTKKSKKNNDIYFSEKYILNEYFITNVSRNDKFINETINKIIKEPDIINNKEKPNKSNKKRKISKNKKNSNFVKDWSEWVSASKVRNYLLKDPLLDWLNIQKTGNVNNDKIGNSIKKINNNDTTSFTSYIKNKGNEFESVVIECIKNQFDGDFIQIGESYDARKTSKFNETIEAMKKGIPIIYQGVLHNNTNQTYGSPDLIVRSDYINQLISQDILTEKEIKIPANKLGLKKYHYRIIDIKCCTLNVTAEGNYLLNSGSVYAYKGQLLIYTQALGLVMGYEPNCAYILGKKWTFTKIINKKKRRYGSDDCFDILGIIDYSDFDKQYINLTNEAINWIKRLRKNGEKWKIKDKNNGNKPSVPELYPNMSNHYDSPWRNVKDDISNEIKEITSLWNCGVYNRQYAHDNDIYSWNDKRCNSKTLGITGKKKGPILDKMLNINRSKKRKITTNIKNNDGDWQTKQKLELFVDFETINEVCTSFDTSIAYNSDYKVVSTGIMVVFMIGLGYELNGKWNFITFLAKDNTIEEERIMIDRFYRYIVKLKNRVLGKNKELPYLYHWGNAEKTIFTKAKKRHFNNNWKNIRWFDLCNIFRKEPIVINGCLNFGLKSVAKAMYKHGFIKTIWHQDNACSNGINAMVMAYRVYDKYKKTDNKIKENEIIANIAEYNEIDCKVLWEILNYLRTNI